jgi:hypothetical protein
MRELINRQIIEQDRKYAICHEEFTDYTDIVPDHKNPKTMGGEGPGLVMARGALTLDWGLQGEQIWASDPVPWSGSRWVTL